MKFEDRGFRRLENGKITIVDIFGDGRIGKHGTFTKLKPGFVSHVHSHIYDYYAIAQNHEPHTTACLSSEECLAFVVQSEKFDVQDLDKKE